MCYEVGLSNGWIIKGELQQFIEIQHISTAGYIGHGVNIIKCENPYAHHIRD